VRESPPDELVDTKKQTLLNGIADDHL